MAYVDEEEFSNPFERSYTNSRSNEREREPEAFAETLPELPTPVRQPFAPASFARPSASAPAQTQASVEDVEPVSTFGAYDVGSYEGAGARAPTATQGKKTEHAGVFASSAQAQGKTPYGASPSAPGQAMGSNDASVAAVAAAKRELERREAELAKREKELAKREKENEGNKRNNWPCRCWALAYHNIGEEIPDGHKLAMRVVYSVYILLCLALLGNMLVTCGRLFLQGSIGAFFMAVIYFLLGVPGAYILWYKRIYNACKNDRAIGFLWFFLMFLAHMGFVVYASLAPNAFKEQVGSLCGVLNLQSALRQNKVLGIFHAVVMSCFMFDALLSFLAVRLIYVSFRRGGHTTEEIRNQAYAEGARASMGGSNRV